MNPAQPPVTAANRHRRNRSALSSLSGRPLHAPAITLFITLAITLAMAVSASPAFAAEKPEEAATSKSSEKTAAPTGAELVTSPDDLPELTRTMHENLREAAASGDLDELRDLFETNELAPVLTDEHVSDPVEHWKSISADGTAREVMAALANILSLPPAKLKNGDFIWPYLAATPLNQLTAKQQIDLFRLAGPERAIAMLNDGKYSHYEAEIGKDGTWHYFKKPEGASDALGKSDLEKKPANKTDLEKKTPKK